MADTNPTPSDPVDPGTPNPAADPANPTPTLLGDDPAPTNTPAPGTDPAPTEDPPVAGDWPEDWRQKYAGEDEKKLKRLERYSSPKAALDALFAAQAKISSGELKSSLKADATPEEVKAWREENGLPETPDKYELALPSGLVIGDSDRPLVDDFLKVAHEANMPPEQVNQAVDWFLQKQEEFARQQQEVDSQTRAEAEDALRAEFGGDFRRNIQIANDLLAGAPEGLKDKLLGGRLADGTPIGNDPDTIRWLVGLSREINPIATVVPGSGANAMQAVETEIAEIKKLMGDHESEYWKGPKSQQLQARYDQLLQAKMKAA